MQERKKSFILIWHVKKHFNQKKINEIK
jgi:hypothetical protein